MAYQVFARKYRPQTFAEVVGQDHITRTLQNAIERGRLAQAYLLVGPRGTGKTSTARIIAKALNCSNGPSIAFDPNEDICVEIAEGRCLDVLEIDGASNNGVEQVRDLRDNARYTPVKGRFKIYIIDEVHMLSTAAFNALLKTLEEPPAHIKFLFATTEAHKLPATIISRCQRFDFRRISDAQVAEHLGLICQKEGVTPEPAALTALARHADGGMRDAETALDQIISFYGDSVREEDVLTMFGLTGLEPVTKLAGALISADAPTALTISRELTAAGKDLGKLTQELLKFFRSLVVYQISPESVRADVTAAESASLQECAGRISRTGALAILDELSTLEGRLRYALNKDILFEVGLIQMSQLKERVSLESILQNLAGSGPAPSVQVTQPAAAPRTAAPVQVPVPAAEPAKARVPAPVVNPAGVWKEVMDRLVAARPLEAALLQALTFKECRGDTFDIAVPTAQEKKLPWLKSPKQFELIDAALKELCFRPMKVVFLLIDEPRTPGVAPVAATPEPAKLTDAEFQNDPLIKQALEMFQAKVVKVTPPAVK